MPRVASALEGHTTEATNGDIGKRNRSPGPRVLSAPDVALRHKLDEAPSRWQIKETELSHPDAFALKNSGLNEFLFAEVGTELNGSTLTVLSLMARLGLDPWAEAARWAKLPPKALTETLTRSIAQMPLSEQAINDAPQTASRLIRLLPEQSKTGARGGTVASTTAEGLGWVPLTFVIVAIAMGIAINLTAKPTIANQPPATQTTAPNPDAVTVPRTG